MKRISKIATYCMIGGAIALAGAGCNKFKDFGDINVNPNGSSEVLSSALITNIESQLGAPIGGALGLSSFNPGLYCQYFAEPTYPGASLYNLPQNNSSGTYAGPLMDCQVLINKNTNPDTKGLSSVLSGGSNLNQEAFARVIKAYIMWQLTDAWGDLPYSEALKGSEKLTPKYDKQEDIYKGILAELADAVSKFEDGGVALRGDIIFNGNTAKWKKFANSLRMLVALRLSKRFPGPAEYAAQQFKAAFEQTAGHITDNADNFTINYPGGNYRNPWFAAGASEDNGVSKTFTDALGGLNDGRLSRMATTNTGVLYGFPSALASQAKILNANLRNENSPLVVVSAASVWLAKAEAIERGWITGDAKAAYDAGVTASFDQWGATMNASYLTSGPGNFNSGAGVAAIGGTTTPGANAATTTKLARIALQQWIAYYPHGLQGWCNWRRSEAINGTAFRGVPDIRPTINYSPSSTGQIIRRYVYGTTEYALNNTNLQAAIGGLTGGDKQESRVWWDKQ
jgi:hypothetical protein